MPPPQTRVPRTTYTTYTYRPRRTTSETAKFQAANIQLAGGWWMTKQSYHTLPSHKRLDTHARAVGATRRTGVISGFAAASLLGIGVLNLHHITTVDVTLPGKAQPPSRSQWPSIVHYRSADLLPEDITIVHGYRVTTPARTFTDICTMHGEAEGLAFLESALHAYDLHYFQAYVARHRSQWGMVRAQRVLNWALYGIDSVYESYARYLIITQLPHISVDAQVVFFLQESENYYRVDLLVDDWLIVEIDGRFKEQGTDTQVKTTLLNQNRREHYLENLGYHMLRLHPDELTHHLIPTITHLTSLIHHTRPLTEHVPQNLKSRPWWSTPRYRC